MNDDTAGQPRRDTAFETALPFTSVLIPVKDGLDLLRQCVEDVLMQDYPGDRFEIIVIDNGSRQSPAGVLPDDDRVRLFFEPGPGSYRARNVGLHHARGEILAFTDADCRPERDWLRTAVQFLVDHPEVDMIGGRVQIAYAHEAPRTGPEWFEFVQGFPQERYIASGFAVTANMISRRSVFDRVGKFDADLMSGGDGEWGRRVRDAGGELRYVESAVVRHPARDTWDELRSKTVRTTSGIVNRTRKRAGFKRRLVQLLLGQLYRAVALPLTVWRLPLPSVAVRGRYAITRWRVDVLIVRELLRGLVSREHADHRRR